MDALGTLRVVARLSPVPQTEPCPGIGSGVEVQGGSPHLWADVLCGGGVDSVDALGILRHVAHLSPLPKEDPCPNIGDGVMVSW